MQILRCFFNHEINFPILICLVATYSDFHMFRVLRSNFPSSSAVPPASAANTVGISWHQWWPQKSEKVLVAAAGHQALHLLDPS